MCDQSEITYSPNEIVWVKLGPVWWPGEVQDYNALPEEITGNLRKQPIAVVKFFQEDSYEYIKNLNHIYRYNCLKKNEFIKKGLDMCRSANSRDVPSNMKMFPEDIVAAEKRTGGNPNILQSEQFAPKEKKSYQELFATPKKPKDGKEGTTSGRRGRPRPSSETKANSTLLSSTPASVSPSVRAITHPRFVGRTQTPDYESRVRQQPPSDSDPDPPNLYRCHTCDFSTIRLNVIVMHNKSHTGSNADFSPKDKNIALKKFTPRIKLGSTPKIKAIGEATKRKLAVESPSVPKRAHVSPVTIPKESKKPSPSSAPPKPEVIPEDTPEVKPAAKKRGPKTTKTEKVAKVMKENETIRNDLLKDWDDEDESAEEEEKSKHIEDQSSQESSESASSGVENKTEDEKTEGEVGKDNEEAPGKSCFDFDESEDIMSHKKPLSFSRKALTVTTDEAESTTAEKKAEHEAEEFSMKVDDLLKETAVPVLPELKLPHKAESFKFDENSETNGVEPEVTSTQTTDEKITNENLDSVEVQEPPTEPAQQNEQISFLSKEPKEVGSKAKAKSPARRTSLVIDFNPDCVQHEPNEPKSEGPGGSDCSVKPDAEASSCPRIHAQDTAELVEQATTQAVESPVETSFPSIAPIEAESFLTGVNVAKEKSIRTPAKLQSQCFKSEPMDGVSSSSDRITAEPAPTIKKEVLISNEDTSHDMKISSALGTRGAGKRGRPSSTKIVVAKRLTPQPPATSQRRKSTSKRVNDLLVPVSLADQEVVVSSVASQEAFAKKEPDCGEPLSIVEGSVLPTDPSQQSNSMVVVSEPNKETVVIAGDMLLQPDQQVTANPGQPVVSTACNLDFDISSMPIVIDNSEYVPSSSGYEKVETVETLATSSPVEVASSVAPVKAEPKEVKVQSPPSFLEKALISKEPNSLKLKQAAGTTSKKTPGSRAEKGSTSKIVLPVQTSGGPTKMRTVKLAGGAKFFSQNSKSPNQFLLLKTSTGQQIVKSSQLIQQPDGKMIILTQNPSSRAGLVVKSISKGEQLGAGKFTTSRIITAKGISTVAGEEGGSSSKQTPNILSKVSGESSKTKLSAKATAVAPGGVRQKISSVNVSSSSSFSPVNVSVAGKVILPNKQGMSKVILSKAGAVPGAKLVMHSSPTKVNLPPSLKKLIVTGGQGNILVSQGAANTSSTNTSSTQGAVSKVVVSQLGSSPLSSVAKVVKVQKQGPNILQKPMRKTTKASVAVVGGRTSKVVTPVMTSLVPRPPVSTPVEPTALPSTCVEAPANSSSTLPSNVVYVAMDNNTYQAVDSSLITYDASQQPAQTVYINPGTTSLENILLTIDEKGNLNLAQQAPQFTTEVVTPTQDILAKALADTQVLQAEASIADAAGRVAYIESLPYPAPPLASHVQETSLTLNQPIMTPLEQPSSAVPVPSNFMIADESDPTKSSNQDMFITQIPGVSSSNVAYQLAVDDTLVGTSAQNQVTSSDSLETHIDEDLLKINKPLKSKSVKRDDDHMEQDAYFSEQSDESKTGLDPTKFIISTAPVSASTSLPSFVVKEMPEALPDTFNVSDVQSELVITSESSDFVGDKCDSMKDEVSESNCIIETEIANGLSSDCGVESSESKETKDVNFICHETVNTSEGTIASPPETVVQLNEA